MDYRQAVERQRNPCNTEPSQTGNPEGVTDTISRPPRSARRTHSPFPRRSGVVLSDHIPSPFQGSVDWVTTIQGLRPFGLHHLPVVFRLSEALIPAQVRRPFRASFDWVCPLCRGCALTGFTACLWSIALSGLAGIDDCPLVETMFALSLSWHSFSRRNDDYPLVESAKPRRGGETPGRGGAMSGTPVTNPTKARTPKG